jgi:hypothetical protein
MLDTSSPFMPRCRAYQANSLETGSWGCIMEIEHPHPAGRRTKSERRPDWQVVVSRRALPVAFIEEYGA